MSARGIENKGTENRVQGGNTKPDPHAYAMGLPQEPVADNDMGTYIASKALDLAVTVIPGIGHILSFLGLGDIILGGGIAAHRELQLPDDDVRMAYSDGYATGLTCLTYGREPRQKDFKRWRGTHKTVFEQGYHQAVQDVASRRPLTEPEFFEGVMRSQLRNLNVNSAKAANAAKNQRLQMYDR